MFSLAALIMSCGGNNAVTLTPESTELKGDLKGCFEVVDKNYKVVEDGINDVINVELKRTSEALPFDPKTGSFNYGIWYGDNNEEIEIGFGIELLDKDNNVIKTIQAGESGWYGVESEDIKPIMKLNEEETGTLRLKIDIESEPVKFRILSSLEKSTNTDEYDTSSTSYTYDSEESSYIDESSTASNNWDETLDEYEKYIDSYIKLYKKAQNGDMSALTEYTSFLEKAQSLSEKLSSAQGTLTPKQTSRFLELQQKLTNAM